MQTKASINWYTTVQEVKRTKCRLSLAKIMRLRVLSHIIQESLLPSCVSHSTGLLVCHTLQAFCTLATFPSAIQNVNAFCIEFWFPIRFKFLYIHVGITIGVNVHSQD